MRILRRTVSVLAVVVLGLAGPGRGAAHATFPGREGRIAYVSVSGSHTDVWTVNSDGSGAKRLTTTGVNKTPRWSADGKHIAFVRSRDIWVMNANGSAQHRVTSLGLDLKPAWSPDGKQLVFIRLQPNGAGDLFRMPSTGGAVTRLTHDAAATGGDDRPSWSPAGGLVLFEQYTNGSIPSIRTVAISTGAERVIPAGKPLASTGQDPGYQPDFAADGQHILFLSSCTPDYCLDSPNVTEASLTSPTRTFITDYDGFGLDPGLLDYAGSPAGGTGSVQVIEDDFNTSTGDFDFKGLATYPKRINGAESPDWQPL